MPHYDKFNVNTWHQLEEALLSGEILPDSNKLVIFAGPVFRNDDEAVRGLKVPRTYWLVAVGLSHTDELEVETFALSQYKIGAEHGVLERIAPSYHQKESRVALTQTEDWTKLVFDPSLHAAVARSSEQ